MNQSCAEEPCHYEQHLYFDFDIGVSLFASFVCLISLTLCRRRSCPARSEECVFESHPSPLEDIDATDACQKQDDDVVENSPTFSSFEYEPPTYAEVTSENDATVQS